MVWIWPYNRVIDRWTLLVVRVWIIRRVEILKNCLRQTPSRVIPSSRHRRSTLHCQLARLVPRRPTARSISSPSQTTRSQHIPLPAPMHGFVVRTETRPLAGTIAMPLPTRHLIYGPRFPKKRRNGWRAQPASRFTALRPSVPPLHTVLRVYNSGTGKRKPVYSIVSRTPVFYITRAPSHCR